MPIAHSCENSTAAEQLYSVTAQLWSIMAAKQPWDEAALESVSGTPSFQWKGKGALQAAGELTYRQKSLPLVPGWSILMQMKTPNPHSVIGRKSTVLTDHIGDTLIGQ